MSGTQQPEALRLAEILDKYALNPLREVAAELRRQHARIEELEEQLSAIGAGGVEPLRKAASAPVAWYVTGCSTILDEHDAKAEARRCGGSAKAVPLYTAPPAHADALGALQSLTRYTVGSCGNGHMHTFAHPDGPFLRYAEVEATMNTQARNKKGIEQ